MDVRWFWYWKESDFYRDLLWKKTTKGNEFLLNWTRHFFNFLSHKCKCVIFVFRPLYLHHKKSVLVVYPQKVKFPVWLHPITTLIWLILQIYFITKRLVALLNNMTYRYHMSDQHSKIFSSLLFRFYIHFCTKCAGSRKSLILFFP